MAPEHHAEQASGASAASSQNGHASAQRNLARITDAEREELCPVGACAAADNLLRAIGIYPTRERDVRPRAELADHEEPDHE